MIKVKTAKRNFNKLDVLVVIVCISLAISGMSIAIGFAANSQSNSAISQLEGTQAPLKAAQNQEIKDQKNITYILGLTTSARVVAVQQRCVLTKLIIGAGILHKLATRRFNKNYQACLVQLSKVQVINVKAKKATHHHK